MMKKPTRIIRLAATGLFAWAFFTWSMPLGLLYVGVILAYYACEEKITPEELATAWLEYRGVERVDYEDPEVELKRATQIAHCVLNRLKGKRA